MNHLRIAETMVSTEANGPGRRLVFWLQGCPLRCPGCFNPELWPADGGETWSLEQALAHLAGAAEIEGVSFTGGEPMAQAPTLAGLAQAVQGLGLSVLCYSGYGLEELRAGGVAGAAELLDATDILIDGPFEQAQAAPLRWRGSANQRVHFLTPRYRHLAAEAERPGLRQAELQCDGAGVRITGIFELELWRKLRHRLQADPNAGQGPGRGP